MIVVEEIEAYGHENVEASHRTTIEVTKDKHLTPRGNCIVGVNSNKAAADLRPEFRQLARRKNALMAILFKVEDLTDLVLAQGSPNLVMSDSNKLIIRKSTYVDQATVAVRANKASIDLDRELVRRLKSRDAKLLIKIYLIDISSLEKVDALHS